MSDSNWIQQWEEKHLTGSSEEDPEIANMDRTDYATMLAELEVKWVEKSAISGKKKNGGIVKLSNRSYFVAKCSPTNKYLSHFLKYIQCMMEQTR